MPPGVTPGARLRELLAAGPLLMPGVFNPISALSAAQAGAKALYVSGAGLTNANLGMPDIALATLSEFASYTSAITAVAQIPVLSDADTGFGEALNVRRCVIELERSGLAGIHLEDQVSPKRCGHLDGKSVIPTEQMVAKLVGACASRRDPNFMIVARTDARGVEGLPSAIERAKAYADAGADAIFPEGLTSVEEFETFREAVEIPLLANMTEFGRTPLISFAQFSELGYNMVIFPMTAFRVMHKALDDTYAELISNGTQSGLIEKMRTRKELYSALNYSEYESLDEAWSTGTEQN